MRRPPVVEWLRFVPGGVDADGYRVPDSFQEPVVIEASFAPGGTGEPREGLAVLVDSDPQLILSDPIDYDPRDRFLVGGREYEAEGFTEPWFGRYSGRLFGQVIKLKGFGDGEET